MIIIISLQQSIFTLKSNGEFPTNIFLLILNAKRANFTNMNKFFAYKASSDFHKCFIRNKNKFFKCTKHKHSDPFFGQG